jgi:Heterokaryon incompatibility protein (HET)
MTDCVNFHKDCNQNPLSKLPRRVIDIGSDTTNMRLVEEEGVYEHYAALSHCWGKKHPLKTTLSTLNCRKQKLEWTSMPATFRDAVTVTRDLGLRYLWIDSLCIIQDDDQDWEVESAKMGSIFDGAHIVIGASISPDPDHSFLDPRQTMFADHLQLNYQREDGSDCIVKARPVVELDASIDPLDRRAWTFQEQRRAVRLLRYSATELKWNCRTKSGCECESAHISGLDNDIIFGEYCVSEVNCSPATVFWDWQTMIKHYTKRRLTRQSDRLPAISGIAASVQKVTSSRYLAGLWEDNLVSDLQWKLHPALRDDAPPTFSSKDFRFRFLRAMPAYRAPTFSWASIDSVVENETSKVRNHSQIDAVVMDAQCTLKGANPFGEVIDGFITLEAAMVQADVTVRYGDDDGGSLHMGRFELTRHGMKAHMTADLPLVECQVCAESGHRERTMKRASVGDHLKTVTGPVFCLRLYRNRDGYQFALVLGRSLRVSGAYERLGTMDFESARSDYNGNLLTPAGEVWFADAERCVVKIV